MIKVGLDFCLALMHLPYLPNGKSGTGLEGSGQVSRLLHVQLPAVIENHRRPIEID